MARIGIGIVGGGYMGKAHAGAFAAVGTVFETRLKPRLVAIAGSSPESGARYAQAFGFDRGARDWRALVEDPEVEAVVIAAPQALHREIAEAAFAQGKPVLCEKPMGLTLEEARANLADWDPSLPSSKAIGAPELIAHLRGESTLGEAREQAIVATRQFAKRQRSWFRSRMSRWMKLSPSG